MSNIQECPSVCRTEAVDLRFSGIRSARAAPKCARAMAEEHFPTAFAPERLIAAFSIRDQCFKSATGFFPEMGQSCP
jgi:hypothetical protein